jgi:Flp pilus assembly protein TadG
MRRRSPLHGKQGATRRALQHGTAAIEMALVLPVYFLLVHGIVQLCFVIFGYNNATYAASIATRYAAVHGTGSTYQCTSTDVQTVATQYLWGAPRNAVTISTTWSPDNNPGSKVTVRISMVYPTAIPFSRMRQITVGTSAQAIILQ